MAMKIILTRAINSHFALIPSENISSLSLLSISIVTVIVQVPIILNVDYCNSLLISLSCSGCSSSSSFPTHSKIYIRSCHIRFEIFSDSHCLLSDTDPLVSHGKVWFVKPLPFCAVSCPLSLSFLYEHQK